MKTIQLSVLAAVFFALSVSAGMTRAAEAKEDEATTRINGFAAEMHENFQMMGKMLGGFSDEQQKKLAEAEKAVVAKLKANPDMINDFRACQEEAIAKLREVLTDEQKKKMDGMMNEGRERARNAVSMNNLKQIALGLIIHANEHQNKLPADLGEVVKNPGSILSPQVFISPYSTVKVPAGLEKKPAQEQADWVVKNSDYIYCGAGKDLSKLEQGFILAYEKPGLNPGGMNYALSDGAVMKAKPEEAKAILKQLQAGINPPKVEEAKKKAEALKNLRQIGKAMEAYANQPMTPFPKADYSTKGEEKK